MEPEVAAAVENPYGLESLWNTGGIITQTTLIILVFMSFYSWFIIFTKWWEQRRLLSQAHEAEKNFWAADNIKTGLNKLSGKANIFKGMAAEAIDAAYEDKYPGSSAVPIMQGDGPTSATVVITPRR